MRYFILLLLLLAACNSAPVEVLSPTPIQDLQPTPPPTPTLAVQTRQIEGEEVDEAMNFIYGLKNMMALGEHEHFAEHIRYPITVQVDGQPKTFIYGAELESYFEKIFSEEHIQQLKSIDESELTFTPQGVKVADGILWFNLICQDPACDEAEFLITEINN